MKGKKTYLRAMEISDMELLRKWNFDENTREFLLASFPISAFEQSKWFEKQISDNSKKKLIIVDSQNNVPVGLVSAMKIDHINKNCELGWTIGDKSNWGKGFASDAVKTLCNFLFNQLNLNMVYAMVLETNAKSLNFCKSKLNFKETGKFEKSIFLNGKYIDNVILCLSKESFNKY